jgi:hypothetical protein
MEGPSDALVPCCRSEEGRTRARERPGRRASVRRVPETHTPPDGVEQRWLLAPGARKLGRVWITVVFACLTVVGVLVVAVLGVRSGQQAVTSAERTEIGADGSLLLNRVIQALQDERGSAEMWLSDPSPDVRATYRESQNETDRAVASLRIGWRLRQEVLEEVGPPTLDDLDEAFRPLPGLRDATLRAREDSTLEAYTGVISVAIAGARRMELIATGSPLSSRVRALTRIVEAGEALTRQRDVVLGILTDDREISQDELVRLLLLQQEARTNLNAIRALGVENLSVSEFLAALAGDEAQIMLTALETAEDDIDPRRWFAAATDRIESLRALGGRVEADLTNVADDLRTSAETARLLGTVGLSALLIVSLLAGTAAVGVARERAKALDEHDALAVGLFEWFLPESLVEVEGVRVAARYDAASEYTRAGGDWYDVYSLAEGRLAMTIGDVAGHGAAATAQMAQARNLLRGITLAAGGSPADQVRALDAALRGSGTMATVFHGVLDLRRGELTYVRAGHPPGLIRTGTSVQVLEAALGSPVGVESGGSYEEATVLLGTSWHVVLFTDGLIEDRQAGIDAGLSVAADIVAGATADIDEMADRLIESRPERLDDAALLVLTVDGVSL